MTQTSSLITGGVTVSAATFAPLVSWGLTGFHTPVPEDVPFLISAVIITICHALYNRYSYPPSPPTPKVPE